MSVVTIVMTTYNGEKYVGEQIDSILSSTYKDIMLQVYDDVSTDSTMDILKKYADTYPDIIHVYQNKTNLGVTRNFLNAISRTTSDYIMLCDQDDVWMPNKIPDTLSRVRHMEAQIGQNIPIAVFTDAVITDGDMKILQDSFFRSGKLNPCKTDLPHLLMENKLIGCTVMINSPLRKIIQSYSLPRQARFHDWWIALIAVSFGRIGFIAEPTMYYRQHGKNVVGNQSFLSYFKNRILSLKKQKEALLAIEKQADEFRSIYKDILSEDNSEIINRFADLHKMNFYMRRYYILRYGYKKTGFIRNMGVMLIV